MAWAGEAELQVQVGTLAVEMEDTRQSRSWSQVKPEEERGEELGSRQGQSVRDQAPTRESDEQ